jgi:hypothetical protein
MLLSQFAAHFLRGVASDTCAAFQSSSLFLKNVLCTFLYSKKGECLKGPKREIFGLGIFAQIRPIWIGDLGTGPKNPKKLDLGPYISLYFPRFLF